MKQVSNNEALRAWRIGITGEKVVFVPTMGALHTGHRSLIQQARLLAGSSGKVVVSIFVNPIQFDRGEDLENYPNPLDNDLKICAEDGADLVFTPMVDDVYHPDASVIVSEKVLSKTLCGAVRPGHFDGVCTVVLKLYHLVQPDEMIFGQKDFQQLAVLKRMVRDLNMPVTIREGKTVREVSGLAMSSRNTRLSPSAFLEAASIYETLRGIKEKVEASSLLLQEVEACFLAEMDGLNTETRLDYIEAVHPETLSPSSPQDCSAVIAVAIFFEEIRLIDHITIDLP